MKNMAKMIKGSNDKLKLSIERATAEMNAAEKNMKWFLNCQLNDDSLLEGLINRARIELENGIEKVYIGSMKGAFKARHYNHKSSFKLAKYKNIT